MEAKLKYLEMIQNVISRMAGNLFYLKGWTITLVTALFALATTKDANPAYSIVAFVPVYVFWILDGYFLSLERSFRSLYDDVRKLDPKDIDFSMNPSKYQAYPENSLMTSMCRPALVGFYLPLLIATDLLMWKLLTP
jgi:hypothetical protein